ncbi:MAG: NYN domain-containing protein [Chloroflexota bacterium]
MQFLIDGHNLIARLPDISLADPDDEAKLVARLKSWTAANSKRKVTVIFDAGLPGGPITCSPTTRSRLFFAPTGTTADTLIIKRIIKVWDVGGYTVVTSDQAIINAARKHKVQVTRSEEFVTILAEERCSPSGTPATPEAGDPRLSPNEPAEWLEPFGPEPESPPPAPKPPKRNRKRRRKPNTSEDQKQAEEIAEWMRLFGYEE